MNEPLLFFDLDDTLLDHRGAEKAAQADLFALRPDLFAGVGFDAWLAAYREANGALWAAFGRGEVGRTEVHHRRFLDPLAKLGLPPGEAGALGDLYLERYAEWWRLNEGAEELLAAASRLGTVGILSNGFRELQRRKIRRFDLERWVKVVVLSEEVGAMKPSRKIFDAAWDAANGGKPARKLYLGDSFETDVLGAKAAGWLPVLYQPDGGAPRAPVLYVRRLVDALPLLS